MRVDRIVSDIEACDDLDELKRQLHKVAQEYGFASFGFVDAGLIGRGEIPFYVGTAGPKWEQEYVRNGFANVDPCLKRARRTNTPFTWSSVPLPAIEGRRTPGAVKTMQAARDHGFRDGLVIPFHFRDERGCYHSTSAVFFWKDPIDRFNLVLHRHKHDLHMILLYWAQRSLELINTQVRGQQPMTATPAMTGGPLTDRERDVLAWAAAGLTVADTAERMNLSADTIETHVRNAMRKLGANNKTHATALALWLGLVDL
jgi:DNA-binding CsgD family transcriptional regulator